MVLPRCVAKTDGDVGQKAHTMAIQQQQQQQQKGSPLISLQSYTPL